MNRLLLQLLMSAAFAAGAVAVPAGGADDKPTPKKPADTRPTDWSSYAAAGEVAGTVASADEAELTLRVPKRSAAKGKAKDEDLTLRYADGGLVRWKKLPPKVGTDGKKASHTPKELEALRQPAGAPGYAAERTDLQPGHVVEVKLVRPKNIPAAKATPGDLVVKYVVIHGESPTVPKPEKKDEAGKKKEKK